MYKRSIAMAVALATGCLVAASALPATGEVKSCPTSKSVSATQVGEASGCDLRGKAVVVDDINVLVPARGETAATSVLRPEGSTLPSTVFVYADSSGGVAVSINSEFAVGDASTVQELNKQLGERLHGSASSSIPNSAEAAQYPSYCGTYTQYTIYNFEQSDNGYYRWYYNPYSEPSSGSNSEIGAGANYWVADSGPCGTRVNDARHLRVNTTTRNPNNRDGFNVVGWATMSANLLGYTNWWYEGRTILEADIRFNRTLTWHVSSSTSVPAGRYDLRSVAGHEMGHAFGFDHETSSPAQVMYPSFSTGVERRVKRSGDLYGMELKY